MAKSFPPILSTGGYNDNFLKFVSGALNSKIVKCHEYLKFVINSIDFCDRYTNDCFFKLNGPQSTKINTAGKIDLSSKPK